MTEEEKENEDYSIFEKIILVLLWFMAYKWDNDLKENGYKTKYRSKIICVIVGILFYTSIVLFANFIVK